LRRFHHTNIQLPTVLRKKLKSGDNKDQWVLPSQTKKADVVCSLERCRKGVTVTLARQLKPIFLPCSTLRFRLEETLENARHWPTFLRYHTKTINLTIAVINPTSTLTWNQKLSKRVVLLQTINRKRNSPFFDWSRLCIGESGAIPDKILTTVLYLTFLSIPANIIIFLVPKCSPGFFLLKTYFTDVFW
jgi:hypothetical protein